MRIGLISDTHGLLRPEAVRALSGVAQIIHAGDVGGPEVIDGLRSIAPVEAVRGNNDRDAWGKSLPLRLSLDIAGVRILVLHDLNELDHHSAETGEHQVVIAGHSHKPMVAERDGILFVNPGSAGPRRFKLPVSIGYLTITGRCPKAEIHDLTV